MYGKFSAQPVFNFLMILIFWEVNKSPEQMGKLNVLDTHKGKEESNVSLSFFWTLSIQQQQKHEPWKDI